MRSLSLAVLAFCLPVAAAALTVDSGTTLRGDTGGIDSVGAVSVYSPHAAYYNGPLAPGSEWVWGGLPNNGNIAQYEFTFDMTGYDLNTAVLSGLWGVDNVGTVALNGTQIASLPSVVAGNYATLHAYGTSVASLFNAGLNTLSFELQNAGGPRAFRATVEVTAESAAVPLPAGGLLLLSGVGALGIGRLRARRG